MSAQKMQAPDVVADHGESLNEVRLVGRLASDPVQRELPSGDVLWTLQVKVVRPVRPDGDKPRQSSDQLDCAVWDKRLQKHLANRREGDVVDVTGALRKRFFQAGGATASRTEVEVSGLRFSRRARSG